MSLSWSCLDKLQDASDHLLIESARQPALEEAHMDQGLGEEPWLTPHRGVGHPPRLHTHTRMHSRLLHACTFPQKAHRLTHSHIHTAPRLMTHHE